MTAEDAIIVEEGGGLIMKKKMLEGGGSMEMEMAEDDSKDRARRMKTKSVPLLVGMSNSCAEPVPRFQIR